jgi:regulatory protein
MLEARSYGAVELGRRLVRRGYPPDEVEACLERLTAAGLLNDAAFARQLARSRVLDRGLAARRVRLELIARGIRPAVATQAVSEVLGDEEVDEAAAAARLARRRSQQLAGLAPATVRRRLYAYLARRGYEADAVRRAVDSVMAAAPPLSGRNSSPRIQNR